MMRLHLSVVALNVCLVSGVLGTWWIANKAYYEYGSPKPIVGRVLFTLRGRPQLYVPSWLPLTYYTCWGMIVVAGCGIAVSRRAAQRRRMLSSTSESASESVRPASHVRAVQYVRNADTLVLLVRRKSYNELIFLTMSMSLVGWLVVRVPSTAMKWMFAVWGLFWIPLIFLERRRPLFLAIEWKALIICTHFLGKYQLKRIQVADIAKVRVDNGANRGALVVELRTGERETIYLSKRAHAAVAWFELQSNATDITFPQSPMNVEAAVAAVSSVLERVCVPVEQKRTSRIPFAWLFRR